jgi:AcrR family transcriptional regulator
MSSNEKDPPRTSSKEQQILDTALALFAAQGYHAVGVDQIKEASGIGKMTLYKHFSSKDVLIQRVLARRDEVFRRSLSDAVAAFDAPWDRLKAVFDWHREWFERSDFNGCMFVKAVEEFPERFSSIRDLSRKHKLWIKGLLEQLAIGIGASDPGAAAQYLLVVLDGLIVHANLFRQPSVVDEMWLHIVQFGVEARVPRRGAR